MTTVLVLPLDDRPVNYDYPRYLARAAGMQVLLPEREWLGNPWRPSQHQKLVDWLVNTAPLADAVILAVDTLAYGGLIPSRRSYDNVEQVMARLEFLKELKHLRPELPVFASSVILRINRSDSSEEEKPYWATYGERMFRLSYLEHKSSLGLASAAEAGEKDKLRGEVPDEVYNDYLAGRARNHAVNMAMIDWAAAGVFDYLVLPQDDTAEYGWNIAEARRLQATIRRGGLTERAITYPGADEIGSLLFASFVCRQVGFAPRIFVRYSSTLSAEAITHYEDRPFHEMVKAHLAPLGGSLAGCPCDADLLLYVNGPTLGGGDGYFEWIAWEGVEQIKTHLPARYQADLEEMVSWRGFRQTLAEMQTSYRSPEEFTRSILAELKEGKNVAIADVVFSNGMDIILGGILVQHPEIAQLASVGGWNTAGNTLGTVLAQAVIRILAQQGKPSSEQNAAHLEFLFLRLIDDYYYQGIQRSRTLYEDYTALGLDVDGDHMDDPQQLAVIEACVRRRIDASAAELRAIFIRSGLVKDVQVSNIHLPWQRLFEVGFDVKVELE
jgi:hypothetical protein